jgi:hypothetical protein
VSKPGVVEVHHAVQHVDAGDLDGVVGVEAPRRGVVVDAVPRLGRVEREQHRVVRVQVGRQVVDRGTGVHRRGHPVRLEQRLRAGGGHA